MRISPEISGTSIVLVGSFNPAIFTPAWFELHGLLPEGASKIADVEGVLPWATSFTAEWLILKVIPESFSVTTVQAPEVRVLDLVVRTFREHLSHTPVEAFGINRSVHFRVRSLAERDRIGRMLAPVEPWGAWGNELGLDGMSGGMTSLTMSQIDPEGRPRGGRINVKVEPSVRISDEKTGVFVNVNDHYAGHEDQPHGAEGAIGLLEESFEASIDRSNRIIDHIMSLTRPQGA